MKRVLMIAVAAVAMTVFAQTSEAQCNGYGFGIGLQQSAIFNGRSFDQPPFFARFPPVYYAEIVPRNYGVSPFAAPAGIMPVEGIVAAKPTKIVNEFYKPKTNAEGKNPKVKKAGQGKKAPWDKSAWMVNPYAAPAVAEK